jgi:hypothetical protein
MDKVQKHNSFNTMSPLANRHREEYLHTAGVGVGCECNSCRVMLLG